MTGGWRQGKGSCPLSWPRAIGLSGLGNAEMLQLLHERKTRAGQAGQAGSSFQFPPRHQQPAANHSWMLTAALLNSL